MAVDRRRRLLDGRPLAVGDRTNARRRRQDPRPLGLSGDALVVQHRHQRFADRKLRDRAPDVERRVGPQGLGRRPDRLLILRRERPQGVLDAVAQLAEHGVGNIRRVLSDEIDADAFRSDQAHDLLHFLEKRRGRVRKQKVRFVEEEHEHGLVGIADFGQALEQFREQPQQKCGVQLRRADQVVGGEDVHDTAAVWSGPQQVVDVEHRLAEEGCAALLLDLEERALDGADRRRRDIPVAGAKLGGAIGGKLQHRAKILEIEQQQAVVVRDLEHQREHALLRGVQVEQAAEEQRTEIGDRGANRIAAPPEHVPENGRRRAPLRLGEPDRLQPIAHLRRCRSGGGHARQVALDVGEEDGHADAGETLGEHLQGDRLPGPGCAGDKAVAVRERRSKPDVAAGGRSREDKWFTHNRLPRLHIGAAAAPRRSISSRANSGPFPSSSCLKYTNTSRHVPVSRAMTSPHRSMSAGV